VGIGWSGENKSGNIAVIVFALSSGLWLEGIVRVRVAMEICGMIIPGQVVVNGLFGRAVGMAEASGKRAMSARRSSEGWNSGRPGRFSGEGLNSLWPYHLASKTGL
jgi:hypothetical protein